MPAKRKSSAPKFGSDLKRVDAHRIQPHEYEEIPEITDEMLARGKVYKGGRPKLDNPKQLITLRLPADVIKSWRASGPGWQTRMAERIGKGPKKAARP